MVLLKWSLGLLVVGVLLALGVGQLGFLAGEMPTNLGVRDGRLQPPSATPNSVSSQAGLYPTHPMHLAASIDPLPTLGSGPATLARIREIVEHMRGGKVMREDGDYLYVQFTTRWMKFVDDAEFWFDPTANVVQVRSASRLGDKDFGVNRKRIEAIREQLTTP